MAPVNKHKKSNIDKIKKTKKESEQRRRDKIKSDPQFYEEFKRKERERYHRRKEEVKIKDILKLSDREKRAQHKRWVEKTRKSRLKKKQEKELQNSLNTPPNSEIDDQVEVSVQIVIIGRAGTSREECGKKVAKRNKSKAYREIKQLKVELEKEKQEKIKLRKSKNKYKMRYHCLKKKDKNVESPRQKVKHFLKGEKASPRIRKRLEFAAVLTTQIEENFKKSKISRK